MTGRKPITYTGTELTRGTPLAGLSVATLAVVQCQRHQVAVVNTDVVRLYIPFAIDTGVRLTYFANGTYRPWMETVTYWPMVESGQIQLATTHGRILTWLRCPKIKMATSTSPRKPSCDRPSQPPAGHPRLRTARRPDPIA
jgi:hypothetical protein